MQGYLYILNDAVEPSWLKIGFTKVPELRLTGYNSSFYNSPISYLYLSIKLENIKVLESILIDRIKDIPGIKCSKKEWFKLPSSLSTLRKSKVVIKESEAKSALKLKHKLVKIIEDMEWEFGIYN